MTQGKKDGGGFVRGMGYILCKLSKKKGEWVQFLEKKDPVQVAKETDHSPEGHNRIF